jgi:hypothetical protein
VQGVTVSRTKRNGLDAARTQWNLKNFRIFVVKFPDFVCSSHGIKWFLRVGLQRNTILHKLSARLHNLSSSLDSKHTTLMGFTHQSIVTVFETLTTPNKKGKKQSPIVDAGDVQKLMLVLPYVLDGLADEFIGQHNARQAQANRVVDPFPDAIMAVNEWLHW